MNPSVIIITRDKMQRHTPLAGRMRPPRASVQANLFSGTRGNSTAKHIVGAALQIIPPVAKIGKNGTQMKQRQRRQGERYVAEGCVFGRKNAVGWPGLALARTLYLTPTTTTTPIVIHAWLSGPKSVPTTTNETCHPDLMCFRRCCVLFIRS